MRLMTLDQVVAVVAQLGFPAFVAIYLLTRFDRLLTTMAEIVRTEQQQLAEIRDALKTISSRG
jgi:hypothetical protein